MKPSFFLLVIGLAAQSACEKDESPDSWPRPSKLLVAIRENNQLVSEFKYDDLERLVQINNYYTDAVVDSETYEYDDDNTLFRRTHAGNIETYEYTDDGKLKTVVLNYSPGTSVRTTRYQYVGDRISRAIIFFNGSAAGYVEYKYDLNGNTILRTEYYGDMIMSQIRLAYDNKINPVRNLSKFAADIIQKNNPTYFYSFFAYMSSFPPEYHIDYSYDPSGLPVKEYRDSRTFEYEYAERRD